MSAQTGKAPEIKKPGTDPTPPVIVKIGGGEPGNNSLVEINSEKTSFVRLVPRQTWEVSRSSSKGRIYGLEVNGTKHSIEPSEELASVRIEFETAELLLMESGSGGDIFLVIASVGVPFDSPEGEWKTATATFPSVTDVTLMVGTTVKVEQRFTESFVTLSVDFEETI